MGFGYNYSARSGRGRRPRRRLNSQINVTPMVDLFLVLLLVFMMTAATLLPIVPLSLPKTDAESITIQQEPVTISIQVDGSIYLQDEIVTLEGLTDQLAQISTKGFDERIYLKGDAKADYEKIMTVMSRINQAGYTNIGLVTDTIRD